MAQSVSNQWFIQRNGRTFGPLSTSRLKVMAARGELKPADLIMRQGTRNFVRAGTVRGLFPSGPGAVSERNGGSSARSRLSAAAWIGICSTAVAALIVGTIVVDRLVNGNSANVPVVAETSPGPAAPPAFDPARKKSGPKSAQAKKTPERPAPGAPGPADAGAPEAGAGVPGAGAAGAGVAEAGAAGAGVAGAGAAGAGVAGAGAADAGAGEAGARGPGAADAGAGAAGAPGAGAGAGADGPAARPDAAAIDPPAARPAPVGAEPPAAARIELPGTSQVPSLLVTERTRHVYRLHLSGMHPSDAILLSRALCPIIARLPADNPLRLAVQRMDAKVFAEEYRSVRAQLLAEGVDTIYFFAEGDWSVSAKLPGYIAIAGTRQSRDRLVARLNDAEHPELADFFKKFYPASEYVGPARRFDADDPFRDDTVDGWLVYAQGEDTDRVARPLGDRDRDRVQEKKRLLRHSFQTSVALRPVAVKPYVPGQPYEFNMKHAWPLTAIHLEHTMLDRLVGPVLNQFFPQAAQMNNLMMTASAITAAYSPTPYAFLMQVAHMKDRPRADELKTTIRDTFDGVIDRAVGNRDDVIALFVATAAKSMIHVSVRENDVFTVMQPPAILGLAAQQHKSEELQDQDWTALAPAPGSHWQIVALCGTSDQFDVLVRAARLRPIGERSPDIRPERLAGGKWRFRVPTAGGQHVSLTINRRGRIEVEASTAEVRPLEVLDESGGRVAVLYLDLPPNDPRRDLLRTRAFLRQSLKERREAEEKAWTDYRNAENEAQKQFLLKKTPQLGPQMMPPLMPQMPGPQIGPIMGPQIPQFNPPAPTPLQTALARLGEETTSVLTLMELEKKAVKSQRRFPSSILVPDAAIGTGFEGPALALRNNRRFAGRWLLGRRNLLTIFEDAAGRVAGVVSTFQVSPHELPFRPQPFLFEPPNGGNRTPTVPSERIRPTRRNDVLFGGKVEGNTLKISSVDRSGKTSQGIFQLNAGGLDGTLSGQAVVRIDTDQADLTWFQGESKSFEGYWIHPNDSKQNVLISGRNGEPRLDVKTVANHAAMNYAAFSSGTVLLKLHVVDRSGGGMVPLGFLFADHGNIGAMMLSPDGQKLWDGYLAESGFALDTKTQWSRQQN